MKGLRKNPGNPPNVNSLGKTTRKPAPDPWQFKVVLENLEFKKKTLHG
jgi:hypothetical protein